MQYAVVDSITAAKVITGKFQNRRAYSFAQLKYGLTIFSDIRIIFACSPIPNLMKITYLVEQNASKPLYFILQENLVAFLVLPVMIIMRTKREIIVAPPDFTFYCTPRAVAEVHVNM